MWKEDKSRYYIDSASRKKIELVTVIGPVKFNDPVTEKEQKGQVHI